MEIVATLVRMLAESGWRVGLPLMVFGVAIVSADKYEIPTAKIFTEYLGVAYLAALAGASLVVTSIISGLAIIIGGGFKLWRARRLKKKKEQKEEQESLKNLETLTPSENGCLVELLRSGRNRVEVRDSSIAYGLVSKKILRTLARTSDDKWICEIRPAVLAEKDKLLAIRGRK